MTARPGDFGVVHVQGAVGWLIRIGQWILGDGFADYEHAFVVVDADADGLRIVEAEPRGARCVHLSIYSGRDIRIYQAPDEARDRIIAAAMSLVGTPYSFLDYAALALWRFKILDHRIAAASVILRGYVQAVGHMMCSQLVDYSYELAGVHLFTDGRLPQDVTPADLYQLIQAQQRAMAPDGA